jgi:threonine aldolase
MKIIDLRSDTVTRPSKEMRDAMARAEVGDDVYGEDPTVNKLQEKAAMLFGKEAALYVPSGTMGNEIAIKAHTRPGDEIIVEQDSHIFLYETGGPSLLSGVQMKTIPGKNGCFSPEQLKGALRGDAYYLPKTSLICLENTHGRSGGMTLPLSFIKDVRSVSISRKIPLHLDGARIWNASVASGISVKEYAAEFDSVSACFSKGLGAPVGSIIVGTEEFIQRCRRYRKIFGGGMRQAGILAAAALYALDVNLGRLEEDHKKAKFFAEQLRWLKGVRIDNEEVQTNMVMFELSHQNKTQTEILNLLKSRGLLLTPEGSTLLRAVTHLDVSMEEVRAASEIIKTIVS